MTSYRIVVLEGDGIGPELIAATLPLLEAVAGRHGFGLEFLRRDAGAGCLERCGSAMPAETFALCRDADAVLKGPVGLPDVRAGSGSSPSRRWPIPCW